MFLFPPFPVQPKPDTDLTITARLLQYLPILLQKAKPAYELCQGSL